MQKENCEAILNRELSKLSLFGVKLSITWHYTKDTVIATDNDGYSITLYDDVGADTAFSLYCTARENMKKYFTKCQCNCRFCTDIDRKVYF